MISAGDFRNGVTFEMDGQVVSIIEFQHVKPGKGAAFVRTKIRNVITGAVVEKTFNPNDKYPTAFIDRKDMEYSYSDGDLYYFMDTETWEQIPINKSVLGDNFKFVKENMVCKVLSYKGNVFGIEPPNFVAAVPGIPRRGALPAEFPGVPLPERAGQHHLHTGAGDFAGYRGFHRRLTGRQIDRLWKRGAGCG